MSLDMGTGSALAVDQPDYFATPPVLRLDAWSCRPSPFGDPKGGILTSLIPHGFQPSLEPRAAEGDHAPCREPSGVRTVRTVRTGSFTANAAEDGAEVSIGDVQTRVSNWCFGVSMPERWRTVRGEVNPSETPYCVRTCQDVSERFRSVGRRCQWPVRTPERPHASASQCSQTRGRRWGFHPASPSVRLTRSRAERNALHFHAERLTLEETSDEETARVDHGAREAESEATPICPSRLHDLAMQGWR